MKSHFENPVVSAALLKQWALEAGFVQSGIAQAHPLKESELLFREALDEGRHAELHFLERDIESRFDPEHLLPGCRSVLVVLYNYIIEEQPAGDKYLTARYTWIEDYHVLVKRQLQQVVDRVTQHFPGVHCRITVDSSCISEKSWAAEAGVGCYGKNGLIHNENGSFFVIGTVLMDCAVEKYDSFRNSDCGTCRLCIDNCPAKALERPYCVDARKCFAYHTVENKMPDDKLLEKAPLLYGCDVCQEVCPKNHKKAVMESEQPKTSLFLRLQNGQLENLSKEDFKYYFGNTAIARRKYDRFYHAIQIRKKKSQ